MELFRNTEGAIAAILHDNETSSNFAEEEKNKEIKIAKVLAKVALINEVTEAGEIFEVEVPADIDEIDLRTYPAPKNIPSKAVALEVENNVARFQAT